LTELLPMPEAPWRIAADAYLYTLAPFLGEIVTLREPLALYRLHGRNSWIRVHSSESLRTWLVKRKLMLERFGLFTVSDVYKCFLYLTIYKAIFDAFRQFARQKGFSVPEDWLLANPEVAARRLVALRAGLSDSPFSEDRMWPLFTAALRANLMDSSTSLRGRVLAVIWLAAVATLPRRFCLPLLALKLKWQARRLSSAGNSPSAARDNVTTVEANLRP
jgi:hypothetical protein